MPKSKEQKHSEANEQARKVMKEFQVKCEAAKVDTHGNPL